MAPDVVLHVDHVLPKALGGADDPSNLVTACKDCNSGKTSTSPNEHLVSDVSEKAFAYAEALKAVLEDEAEQLSIQNAYQQQFEEAWNDWRTGDGRTVELPNDWRGTLAHWQKIGLPFEIVSSAIDIAMEKQGLTKRDGTFRYMCGIVWRTLEKAQDKLGDSS